MYPLGVSPPGGTPGGTQRGLRCTYAVKRVRFVLLVTCSLTGGSCIDDDAVVAVVGIVAGLTALLMFNVRTRVPDALTSLSSFPRPKTDLAGLVYTRRFWVI